MRFLLLSFILTFSLVAKTTIEELRYESGISIYGQIGYVTLRLEENLDEQTYKIQATTTSTGIVKYLSSNRIDTFVSEGNIKDGVYVPMKFTRITSKNGSTKERVYSYDYVKKNVLKVETINTLESHSEIDVFSLKIIKKDKMIKKVNKEIIDFKTNDFLSLYLNLQHGNLDYGKVPYIDMKVKDDLFFVQENLFEVHKNNGEEKYSVSMIPSKEGIFFEQVTSVDIGFYGDAYIKKLSQTSITVD